MLLFIAFGNKGNPCATASEYRQSVIKALPRLISLDNVDVTPEEKQQAGVPL